MAVAAMEWWKGGDGGRSCDGGGSGSNGRGSGIVTVVLVGIGVAGGNINCETISSDIPIIMLSMKRWTKRPLIELLRVLRLF